MNKYISQQLHMTVSLSELFVECIQKVFPFTFFTFCYVAAIYIFSVINLHSITNNDKVKTGF